MKCKNCFYYQKYGDHYICEEPHRRGDKRYKISVGGGKKACKFFAKKRREGGENYADG